MTRFQPDSGACYHARYSGDQPFDPCGTTIESLNAANCALRLQCEAIDRENEETDYNTNKNDYNAYVRDKPNYMGYLQNKDDYTAYIRDKGNYNDYKYIIGNTSNSASREETRYADLMNQYSVSIWVALNLVLGLILLAIILWRSRK